MNAKATFSRQSLYTAIHDAAAFGIHVNGTDADAGRRTAWAHLMGAMEAMGVLTETEARALTHFEFTD